MSDGFGRGLTGDLTGLVTDQMTGADAYGNMSALDFNETWHLTENFPAHSREDVESTDVYAETHEQDLPE